MATFFTVLDTYKAYVPDGADPGNEPDEKGIAGTVTFTPSVSETHIDIGGGVTQTVRLEPIVGRFNEPDGVLSTLDDTPGVKLLAGSATEGDPLYGLTYKVEFTDVVYNKKRNQIIDPFRFVAPTTAVIIRLSDPVQTPRVDL